MVPPVPRLKSRSEFLRVAGARRKWVAPGLILQARRHRSEEKAGPEERAAGNRPPFRVGFTVSRKVGNAVQRNRARRRLRAVVATVMPEFAEEGYDFVVIGRAATLKRPFPALKDDLIRALRKLHAVREAENPAP